MKPVRSDRVKPVRSDRDHGHADGGDGDHVVGHGHGGVVTTLRSFDVPRCSFVVYCFPVGLESQGEEEYERCIYLWVYLIVRQPIC